MALYRSGFRLVEGCSKTFQACPPNFPFFRTNFASSKMLSVVVRVFGLTLSSLNLTTAPNRLSCIYS
jgi:hypothetical protein